MKVTKERLIKEIAEHEKEDVVTVRKVFHGMEERIVTYLSATMPDDKTVIKLFDGLSIECEFVPQKEMKHPSTGENIVVQEKIWANAKLTRYLNQKLNIKNKEAKK